MNLRCRHVHFALSSSVGFHKNSIRFIRFLSNGSEGIPISFAEFRPLFNNNSKLVS
ncbi:hypothetical protein B4135_2662 [Caldibacillus debilis]|uniref:Uncharacterized protein n=1 Tax=Caldibacillus debilis TaxID=301148 RepID=A0A150LVC9_9BACI|nr:hypothetical protein B4135_2662 [Caldibacillus debilis]